MGPNLAAFAQSTLEFVLHVDRGTGLGNVPQPIIGVSAQPPCVVESVYLVSDHPTPTFRPGIESVHSELDQLRPVAN